jgi:hypothetical protein
VPDKRFILSPIRTRNLKSSLLILAVTGPALALMAAAVATAGSTSVSAAAQLASVAGQAHVAHPAEQAGHLSTAGPAGHLSTAGPAGQLSSVADSAVILDTSAKQLAATRPRAGASQHQGGPVYHGSKHSPRRRHHHRYRSPRQIARSMLRHFHWSQRQFRDLDLLWSRESGWSIHAINPYSGAYGIPQAVPGAKMATAGPSWRSNARTQIRWGLRYIRDRYGSPVRAWAHEVSVGWY